MCRSGEMRMKLYDDGSIGRVEKRVTVDFATSYDFMLQPLTLAIALF
jgi:hypothetical protein